MRVLFFGTPQFAVPTLERLIEAGHEVAGVVTQPDKPAGRGRKLSPPPVKVVAEQHGIPVLQPSSVKTEEFTAEAGALRPEVGVVVAYGKILPRAVLELPQHGCLNVHASLLPAYRGAAPIQWAIVNGERKTGVTIMQMDEGMDTGPMITQEEVDILEDDDAVSVGNMLSLLGADLMVRVLGELEREGKLQLTAQDDSKSSRAPLIKREMGEIDWSQTSDKVIWAVRGFLPWPCAYTKLGGKELKIVGVDACDPSWVPATAFDEKVAVGSVVEVLRGRGFVVRTGGNKDVVLVTRVKPEGRPEMGAFDFVNGGGVDVGVVLGK